MGKKYEKNWPAFSLVAYIIGMFVGVGYGILKEWGEFVSEAFFTCAFLVFVVTWCIWVNAEEKILK